MVLKGGGFPVQGQKSWRHDFEIIGTPKGHIFGWVLRPQTQMSARGPRPFFGPKREL